MPPSTDVRPTRSLWLLVLAHAFNHAQVAVLPLVYLALIDEWGVTVPTIAFLTAASSLASGAAQLSFSALTRRFSRRSILGWGNVLFGAAMAAQALAASFLPFAAANILSYVGASQQHPVGNGLIAEQFPPQRRGVAISAHIAGGNVGTVAVPLIRSVAHRRRRVGLDGRAVRHPTGRDGRRDPGAVA